VPLRAKVRWTRARTAQKRCVQALKTLHFSITCDLSLWDALSWFIQVCATASPAGSDARSLPAAIDTEKMAPCRAEAITEGGTTIEATRSLDVIKLACAGYLGEARVDAWQWSYHGGSSARISIAGRRDAVRPNYRVRSPGDKWQWVSQRVPVRWSPCRFGGCSSCATSMPMTSTAADESPNSAGAADYSPAAIATGSAMWPNVVGHGSRAHHLTHLFRKLAADYDSPDMPMPWKPKWMRRRTCARIAQQSEEDLDHLDTVFNAGAARLLDRLERSEWRWRRRR
jgi:hypothetical protein